jgi:PKD repeat protein
VGGIMQAGDGVNLKSAQTSMMVDNWDWRNRHGKNWVTEVKNQAACGSCWAFAATGATEAQVNLFYNQPLNMDLSEQNLLSCSGAGSCSGGYPAYALDYIKNIGIIDEAAFPYTATNDVCTNKSSSPTDQFKIGGRVDFGSATYPVSEDNLKKMIIKYGPISGGLYDWSHAMVLLGWKVVKVGDKFYTRDLNKVTYWITIPDGSPLIGTTVWIFKNSWGVWGDGGYVYVQTLMDNISSTYGILNPVVSLKQSYTVQCVDNDHDGYYWWGLGPKPANCPPCPALPDGNDADATLGPLDSNGNCILLNGTPIADFTSNTTTLTANGSVNFIDLSTNAPTSWSWSFPGGTPSTSTAANPVVSYLIAGTYDVSLIAINSNGSNTKLKLNNITVNPYVAPNPAPVADFTSNTTTLTANGSVNFTDLSTNTPVSWAWTFDGGTPATSTATNPAVSYKTAGKYNVTLVVTNANGNNTKIKTGYVTVNAIIPTFTYPSSSGNASKEWISQVSMNGSTYTSLSSAIFYGVFILVNFI